MRRENVALIWIGGLVLAVALYAIGPDRFLDTVLALTDSVEALFREMAFVLGVRAYGVVRALCIAMYVVFVVLAFLASQRGQRGFWPFVVVTMVLLMLVWRPFEGGFAPLSRWCAALVLVLVGAAVMSQRLTAPPPGPPPYPYGGGRR